MKLSISNIGWDARWDEQVYRRMKACGYQGIEIAPTRWIPEQPYDHIEKAKQIADTLKEQYGFEVSSMQSIWYGRKENMFASEEERRQLMLYTRKAIDFAAAINCHNLVFGCPRSRNILPEYQLTAEEIEKTAVDFFYELGEYAKERGTVLALEANPPIYHTNFVNTTEEAICLVKKVQSEGFLVNLDLGTMICNEEDTAILRDNIKYINHIHISEPGLAPVQLQGLHNELKELLKEENYQGYLSIEMGKTENISELENILEPVRELFK